jgi:hypothetical protein
MQTKSSTLSSSVRRWATPVGRTASAASIDSAGASSAEAYTAAVEGAGFTGVTVQPLTELYDLELRHRIETKGAERPEVHLQYLITAAR